MKIKVALHGMDKRCEDRMHTVFQMIYKGSCEHTDIDKADTVILDLDGKNVDAEWTEFRKKYPNKPVVVMAEKALELPGAIYIPKPAKLPDLLEALKSSSNKTVNVELKKSDETSAQKVASALQQRVGQASGKNSSSSSGSFELYFDPQKFLQGRLVEAIKKSNMTEESIYIKCWSDRWIIVFPFTPYLFENVKESQLRNLGLVQVGEEIAYSEHELSDDEIRDMANTPSSQVKVTPVSKFLWDISVKTARGRFPENTSLDDLYVLQHWPNLTRLQYIPDALRISALWLNQPQSINNIITKLGVSIEDIANYFSAALSTGALIPAKRQEDKMVTPEVTQVDKGRRGIFASLMRKVSRNVKHDTELAE